MLSGVQFYQPLCFPEHVSHIEFIVFSSSLSTEDSSGFCITWLWPQQLVLGVHKSPAVKLFLLYAQVKGLAGEIMMCWHTGCCGRA